MARPIGEQSEKLQVAVDVRVWTQVHRTIERLSPARHGAALAEPEPHGADEGVNAPDGPEREVSKTISARQAQNEHLLMKAFSRDHAAATWSTCLACLRRFKNQKIEVIR